MASRGALRRSKLAVLQMLEEKTHQAMTEASWVESTTEKGQRDHEALVDQALAYNELRDSLARRWKLVRVTR